MTEENKVADATEELKSADAQVAAPVEQTAEQVIAENKALKAEAEKNSELLKKLRKFEKENKDRADKEAVESGRYKELYEAADAKIKETESKLRTRAADEKLKELLTAEKAKSLSTVMKLIDRSKIEFDEDGEVNVKSLAALVKSVKETDSILFDGAETPVAPNLKRATEGDVTGGYEKELAALPANTRDISTAIYKIMKKYNKV
jgi:vacuolar-type H+-ATPase subunit I/STV1